ncbi:MAG: DUF2157 domain-containing protein [Nitrospirae bacterium]|nr:DUF2157 domain-containing protein [Nitrospirota bacterium]
MKPPSKIEAQKRADQIRAFQSELAQLERDKVVALTDEQRSAIHAAHETLLGQLTQTFDIDRTQREKQLSLGMRIASFLGALAFAASVFYFFYQFWGRLSTTAQVLILILAPLSTFVATILISWKDQSGYFAKLAGLVSFACFVLNISMLGQIFNIAPSDKAFIVWSAFALLLAYSCEVRLLLAAGILCFIAFLSARMGTWSGIYWLYFGERPENFFPAAAFLFVVPQFMDHRQFSGFASIYRVFGLLTLFIPILILANWGGISYLNADPNFIEGAYQVAGFVLSAAAIGLGIRKKWGDVVNTGNAFFVIFLYTKFYDWWWDVMPKYLFFLIVGLTAVLFLLILKRLRSAGLLHRGVAND